MSNEHPPLITHEEQALTRRRAIRSSLAIRIFVVYVVVASTLTSAVLLYLAIQDHHRIQQNQAIQEFIKVQAIRNHHISEEIRAQGEIIKQQAFQINDCTQPTGKCYKQGQKRTGEAVGSIGMTSVAAASCSVHIGVAHPELSQPELTRRVTICTTRAVTGKAGTP